MNHSLSNRISYKSCLVILSLDEVDIGQPAYKIMRDCLDVLLSPVKADKMAAGDKCGQTDICILNDS